MLLLMIRVVPRRLSLPTLICWEVLQVKRLWFMFLRLMDNARERESGDEDDTPVDYSE